MVGNTLGHYEIIEPLGAGGMGEVYRARDTKLARDVAIKVLPAHLADDPERLARMQREAQLLAALNHPNIAAIYGLEDADGVTFLAMELAEGQTLAQKLSTGALGIDEALEIALQIAEALESAHEAGIVHRDLKPANVQVATEGAATGQVKVLDFGLAKAYEPDGTTSAISHDLSASPTMALATHTGVIMGTAAYMSPEQARGKPVDARTDIWAFGCVLFEMLAGEKAFTGETASDTMAAILKEEPDWESAARVAPAAVLKVLRRCLAKDPRLRLHSIADARIELAEADESPDVALQSGAEVGSGLSVARFSWLATGLAIGALLTALALQLLGPSTPTPSSRQLTVSLPNLAGIDWAALSPPGEHVAFIGEERLWVRRLTELTARELPGTARATNPFWSPDGRWIGYFVAHRVFKINIDGGSPVPVATMARECAPPACGGAWTSDGRILMSNGVAGILMVPEEGGTPIDLLTPGENEHFHQMYLFPEGGGFVFNVDPDSGSDRFDAWNGERRVVVEENAAVMGYSPSGHVVYAHEGSIWALPFSAERLEPTGEPFIVAADATTASVSNDGSMLLRVEVPTTQQLVWVGRDGLVEEVVDQPTGTISSPALSLGGDVIAFTEVDQVIRELGYQSVTPRATIWTLDPRRGTRAPLIVEPGIQTTPAWAADGQSVYYVGSDPDSFDTDELLIRTQPVSGGADRIVVRGYDPMLSADGSYLVFSVGEYASRDIHFLRLDDTSEPVPFSETPTMEAFPQLSHDGRLIAYVASATGMTGTEVYLRRFPGGEQRTLVSGDGGAALSVIRWAPDDAHLFYVRAADGVMMEIDVENDAELRLSDPRELFDPRNSGVQLGAGFDVAADGLRFLVVRQIVPRGAQMSRYVLKSNWLPDPGR